MPQQCCLPGSTTSLPFSFSTSMVALPISVYIKLIVQPVKNATRRLAPATLITSGYSLLRGVEASGAVARFGSMPGTGKRENTAFLSGISLKVSQPNMPPILSAALNSGLLLRSLNTVLLTGCSPRALTAALRPRKIRSSAFTPHGQLAEQVLQFRHIPMMLSNSSLIGSLPLSTACIREILPLATENSFFVSR